MTNFTYIYKNWAFDEGLAHIFDFISTKRIPIELWKRCCIDDRNRFQLAQHFRGQEIINLRIPLFILKDWLENDMNWMWEQFYDRLLSNIFNQGHRSQIWWHTKGTDEKKMINSIILYSWDSAQDFIDEWFEINRLWDLESSAFVTDSGNFRYRLNHGIGKTIAFKGRTVRSLLSQRSRTD